MAGSAARDSAACSKRRRSEAFVQVTSYKKDQGDVVVRLITTQKKMDTTALVGIQV